MYGICKNVILSGRYELSAMLRKLDTLWLQSQISDEQKTELEQLAREHADPAMSVDLLQRIEDHETRLKALEAGNAGPQPEGMPPEYRDGMSARNGELYLWQGKTYRCIAPAGQPCVWSPGAYPAYWQAV